MFKKLMSSIICLAGTALLAQDVYYGDWKGTLKTAAGEQEIYAQVIDHGKGSFRAVFKNSIYKVPAAPVLLQVDGTLRDGSVVFPDGGVIANGEFKGATKLGEIAMKPYRWVSPTLGLKPPEGATVLVGPGLAMSQWRNGTKAQGIVDFNKVLAREPNRVAYMSATIVSDKAQKGLLKTGSDDGLIVFLNGKEIFRKNVPRSFTAGEDTIPVELAAGENKLLLKVTQGGGDWMAQARLCGADNKALAGVRTLPWDDGMTAAADGSILGWQVAGPFKADGKGLVELGDVAFAPETGAACEWKTILNKEQGGARWDIPEDGVIAVRRGGGSIVSGPEFGACQLHLEFRTTLMAEKRGQGRCNSGVYMMGRTEFQVLDSYALKGLNNECGGVYQHYQPQVNMCLPPGQWQTYDFDFTPATFAEDGKTKIADGHFTLKHNGVVIHDNCVLVTTPGGLGQQLVPQGPLMLQDHGGDVVEFRNVWFVKK